MPVEVVGLNHVYVNVYITVGDLGRSKSFYDPVMAIPGFRKREGRIGGDPRVHYYNRHQGYSLRPAREGAPGHNPYAPGLHHFCFRVVDEAAVDRAARELRGAGVDATQPRYYPEYDEDYYATFFSDPDGVRLEVTNFRERRRRLMYDWDARTEL